MKYKNFSKKNFPPQILPVPLLFEHYAKLVCSRGYLDAVPWALLQRDLQQEVTAQSWGGGLRRF